MDLNLEAAFDEPVDLSHEFEIPSARLERPELLSLSPVSFTGRLERADLGFVLRGHLAFSGVVACARCLDLDHIRAEVSEYLRTVRARPQRGHVKDTDPIEWRQSTLLAKRVVVLYRGPAETVKLERIRRCSRSLADT
jgi:hypothetical protein